MSRRRRLSYPILRHWSHILSNSHRAFEVQSNHYCFQSGNTGSGIFKNSGMLTDTLEERRHVVPAFLWNGRWDRRRSILKTRRWIAVRLRCCLRLRECLTGKRGNHRYCWSECRRMICWRRDAHSGTGCSHCLILFSITSSYTFAASFLFLLHGCFAPTSCIWQIGQTNFMRVLWNILLIVRYGNASKRWSSSYSMRELPRCQSRFYSLLMLDSPDLQAEETDRWALTTDWKPIGHLSTGNLSDPFWMFFDIFFTSASGVSSTDKFCMILESRRFCFASMRITLAGCRWELEGQERKNEKTTFTNSTHWRSSSVARHVWKASKFSKTRV